MEQMYSKYVQEQLYEQQGDIIAVKELLQMLLGNRLIQAVLSLKEKEQKILYARVFGMKNFDEIGKEYDMNGRQTEMTYYYVIRKIRKQMEENNE